MRYEPLGFRPKWNSSICSDRIVRRNVLRPTCSCLRKWCGSDDDADTNTGRESSRWTAALDLV